MLLPLLVALLLPQGSAADSARAGGPVALLGAGALLDASNGAGIAAKPRLLIVAVGSDGDPTKTSDPFAAAGPPAWRIVLDSSVLHAGDDREAVARAREAGCIVLAGGAYLDWFHLLKPGGWPSAFGFAIREAHASGVPVVGAGAAAPFLADWALVERRALGKTPRNPRREREDVAVEGLGLVRGLLVDSSACERGDPARALRSAFDGRLGQVLFLAGPVVWIAESRGRTARVSGPGRALFFDLSDARWQRDTWREGRLSLLGQGDSWSARKSSASSGTGSGERRPASSLDSFEKARDIQDLRRSLARASARLSLRADERTYFGEADAARGVLFDLEWEPR